MAKKKGTPPLREMIEEAPQDVEMEKFVLGAMMLKDGLIIPNVSAILDTEDFYRPEHRTIYAAIMKLHGNGIIPNVLSLVEELRTTKDEQGKPKLDSIGLEYILGIVEIAHTTAYAETYARNIKEKSDARQMLQLANEIVYAVQNNVPLADINYFAVNRLNTLARVESSRFIDAAGYFEEEYGKELQEQLRYSFRKTGFSNIDEYQIFGAGLYVLGGVPACGKTTFAWQLAEQLAENGEICIFCSYEMSALELMTKSLARRLFLLENQNDLEEFPPYDDLRKEFSYSAAELRRGYYHRRIDEVKEKWHAQKLKLRVIKFSDETVDDLLKTIRPLCINVEGKEEFKAPVVFIDYLQIIRPTKEGATAKAGIDEIVRKLKLFQRETNTTFIVISSFNRANYLSPCFFESFKESGGIEYSADIVWGLQSYAAKYYSASKITESRLMEDTAKRQQPREIQLKCLKNRQGGNYDCYFRYFSRHDYFQACEETNFSDTPPETSSPSYAQYDPE